MLKSLLNRLVLYVSRIFTRRLQHLIERANSFLSYLMANTLTDPASSSEPTASSEVNTRLTPHKIAKPTKKATVEELRGNLALLGLETRGKKETLLR